MHCLKKNQNCFYCYKENILHIQILDIKEEKEQIYETKHGTIIFLLSGEVMLSYNSFKKKHFISGQMVMLPSHSKITIKKVQDASMLILPLSFDVSLWFCKNYPFSTLVELATGAENRYYPLNINNKIKKLLFLTKELFDGGDEKTLCTGLIDLMVRNIITLIHFLYKDEELGTFFAPFLNRESVFTQTVLKYYKDTDSAEELAKKMNCSYSAFRIQFKKNFSMPVYQWMQIQKAERVLNDLQDTSRSIKEIGISNHFSSQARFYEFCKKYFQMTPVKIREKVEKMEKVDIVV